MAKMVKMVKMVKMKRSGLDSMFRTINWVFTYLPNNTRMHIIYSRDDKEPKIKTPTFVLPRRLSYNPNQGKEGTDTGFPWDRLIPTMEEGAVQVMRPLRN